MRSVSQRSPTSVVASRWRALLVALSARIQRMGGVARVCVRPSALRCVPVLSARSVRLYTFSPLRSTGWIVGSPASRAPSGGGVQRETQRENTSSDEREAATDHRRSDAGRSCNPLSPTARTLPYVAHSSTTHKPPYEA